MSSQSLASPGRSQARETPPGQDDPLGAYIHNVHSLGGKFARIAAGHQASAESLGRAAAALRSMALGRRR